MAQRIADYVSSLPPEKRFVETMDAAAKGRQCCKKFIRGECPLGDDCRHWHPKTGGKRLCLEFQKVGGCPKGAKCEYAHIQLGVDGARTLATHIRGMTERPTAFRTSECTNIKNTGSCKFGDKCRYRHT